MSSNQYKTFSLNVGNENSDFKKKLLFNKVIFKVALIPQLWHNNYYSEIALEHVARVLNVPVGIYFIMEYQC